jgi:hypothetical protein
MKRRILFVVMIVMMFMLSGCTNNKVQLFNGSNLDGWSTYFQDESVKASDVWSVQNGVINCKGKPNGYLRTVEEYSDYKLHLEWRWVGEPTNSGVLLHTQGEDKIWPLCVEAQLMHNNAGDFVTIQHGSVITVRGEKHTPPADKIFKVVPKEHPSNEKQPGQWNSYDIICKDDTIKLYVNGKLQNSATEVSLTSGNIGLQSEGSEIEFRNIYLERLK